MHTLGSGICAPSTEHFIELVVATVVVVASGVEFIVQSTYCALYWIE